MGLLDIILTNIPEVAKPTQSKLGFKEKLKWTLIILVLFFILGAIPLFGMDSSALTKYENLAMILGAKFGTLISLGIGPIVTASIVLQLLNGSGLFKFDTSSPEGRARFQGIQKLAAYGFIIFEAIIYVVLGGLAPNPALQGQAIYTTLQLLIIVQLIIGGVLVLFMDDVIQKWGFGSGISLFIAAGVSQSLFIRIFSPIKPAGSDYAVGAIFQVFQAVQANDMATATTALSALVFTFTVFAIAIYAQAMRVEIPLSFGRVRGHGIRWPLNFLYTSNIPVILIAALLANIQIGAQLLTKVFPSINPTAIQAWVTGPRLVPTIIQSGTVAIGWTPYLQALVYLSIFMVGAATFSWFWVQTSGMDAASQAKNIMRSGLQIPGFRKDPRIMEKILNRYIGPLTIMGGLTVGILATFADLSGALGSGTGILLTVMILYKMYEDIAKQHMSDMNPGMKSFMGG